LNTSVCVTWGSTTRPNSTLFFVIRSGTVLNLVYCRAWRGTIEPWSTTSTSVPQLLVTWREWDTALIESQPGLRGTDGVILHVVDTGLRVTVLELLDLHGLPASPT
jgi:hypothetical protein